VKRLGLVLHPSSHKGLIVRSQLEKGLPKLNSVVVTESMEKIGKVNVLIFLSDFTMWRRRMP